MRTAPIGSVSDHRAENGTTKYPESLCLTLALPSSGRRVPPPAGTLLPGHGSYRLIRQSRWLSSRSAEASFEESLQVATSPCCQQDLPDVISVNPSLGAWAPVTAVPRSAHACFFLHVIGLPPSTIRVGFPHCSRQNDFMTDRFSRLQPFLYVQAPWFAHLPDRSYRCDSSPQGSRGFVIRAAHASLPPHASDQLTTRSQAIDGVGTCTPRDSQPCRLLQCIGDLSRVGVRVQRPGNGNLARENIN
jgi:hypothetical protein